MNARLKNIPTNGLHYKKSLLLRRDGNGFPESRVGEEAAQTRCSSMEKNTEEDTQPSISSKQCHSTDSKLNLETTETTHSGTSDPTPSDGCTPQLSPKHAERAAMLKERFAGLIRKATSHSELSNKSSDPSSKRKENVKLEDSNVKEVSSTLEENRAATRMEIEKMEKQHALFEGDSSAVKELMILCCADGFEEFFETNPLEKFGLFLKHDDEEDDDDDWSSALEEGEIQA
ncbi:hypothetical protein M569_07433 [Genlisea aurea]|uniref:Uncharacterized protein n=1 Tax=Genlisea aurea TaxID=192259 RepID=S8E4W8_9LAMI|nr:hypothetical protein M569_07433 [Genlisea aurea]